MKVRNHRGAGLLLAVLLAASVVFAGHLSFGETDSGGPAKALDADGVIEPSLVTTVGCKNGGIVDKVDAEEGELVKADTALVTLRSEAEAATAEVSRLKAEDDSQVRNAELVRDYQKAEYEATNALFEKKVASEQERRKAFAQYKIAELNVDIAKLEHKASQLAYQRDKALLDAMTIRAPSEGFVTQRLVDAGEGIQPLQPVMEITTLNPLHVVVNMSDEALGRIKKDDKAEVVIEQLDGLRVEGVVIFVSPVVDYASKTFKIKISVPNAEFKIPAGLKARVVFANPKDVAKTAPPPVESGTSVDD